MKIMGKINKEETINLNQCKFGDRLKTKSGHMAIMLSILDTLGYCKCAVGLSPNHVTIIRYNPNGKPYCDTAERKYSIISKWED